MKRTRLNALFLTALAIAANYISVLKAQSQEEQSLKGAATQSEHKIEANSRQDNLPSTFVATFDDLELAAESYWNGSDGSGGFISGPAFFYNSYNPDWFSWSGWSYSNISDNTTAGWSNQYSAITGEGVHPEGGSNYGVSFASPASGLSFADGAAHEVRGFYVTNATYAALSMKYGDDFSKKFGGADGTDPDWFLLTVSGFIEGEARGDVTFYLADFTAENPSDDYILDSWEWVDLTSLGKVDSLSFSLSSTDMGDWGMNTPAYFAMDDLQIVPSPYISEVVEYVPAPGQFINTASGSPSAAASITGGITGTLSLGAFGGSVVFRFHEPVENHPDNPYGVDFTIFGNPMPEWSEPGVVSVMQDENQNGLPDEPWFELAGSDHFFSTTDPDYAVTYTHPGDNEAAPVPWSDNRGNNGFIPDNGYYIQSFYPLQDSFPGIDVDQYTLSGTMIASNVEQGETAIKALPRHFGYADNRMRGMAPYEIPDNPYTAEIENSGGDAFDISWAVDASGQYVDLDEIHFVRVQTAVLDSAGWLGEVSTEIAGAVDVAPAAGISGETDMIVIKPLPDTIRGSQYQLEAFLFSGGRLQREAEFDWTVSMPGAAVDASELLTFESFGELTLTATPSTRPEITASVHTVVDFSVTTAARALNRMPLRLYPNPASDHFMADVPGTSQLSVYNISGRCLIQRPRYTTGTPVSLNGLSGGVYLVRINYNGYEQISKLMIY